MSLTINQHILHELQSSQPLTEQQLKSALKEQEIDITLINLDSELTKLIEDGWVEYYEIKDDTELAYELCNRWYNLEESERKKILVN